MLRTASILSQATLSAGLLAACSASGTALSGAGVAGDGSEWNTRAYVLPAPNSHQVWLSAKPPLAISPSRAKTWISPSLKSAKQRTPLLFVTDGSYGTVNIFSFPYLSLEAVITGFYFPEGECADRAGNVWIAQSGNETMVELSRTGSIVRTITDTIGYPVSCAINPRNGDLAVTNLYNNGYAAGSVLIYPNASGTPSQITCPDLADYRFDGFDNDDHLIVDGVASDGSYEACYGSESSVSPLAIDAGLYSAGAVVWSPANKYWDFFDQDCQDNNTSCAYWMKVSNGRAKSSGVTNFTSEAGGLVCDVIQGVLSPDGNAYLGAADYEAACDYAPSAVYTWNYPYGGIPESDWSNNKYITYPIGAAITPSR